MAYGLPCVATPAALEGMELDWGSEILVADSAQAFADTVVDLYENRELWDTISGNSAASIERLFSKEVAEENMRNILRHHRRESPDERG
jgi:glycosyltransferase involved in cell wall biosynthesis